MKHLLLLPFLFSCSSTKWTERDIQKYADGFFHGCSYVEAQKDMNLDGLVDCANKRDNLVEFYRRTKK